MIVKGLFIAGIVLIAIYLMLPILGIVTAPIEKAVQDIGEGKEVTTARQTTKEILKTGLTILVFLILGLILIYSIHTRKR